MPQLGGGPSVNKLSLEAAQPAKKRRNQKKKGGGQSPTPTVNNRGADPYTNRREDSPRHHLSTNPMASDRSPHCDGTETPLVNTNQAVTLPSPHPGLTPAPSAPSVLSVGSSPFHGAPVSATQLCEVPDGEPAPVTPEWMLHAPSQPAEAGQQMTHAPCACVSSYLARLGREVGTRCTLVAWRTCA